MALLRQKSGRPNASEFQRPLALQKLRSIARTLPGAASEHEIAQLALQMQNYMEDHFGRYSAKPRLMTRLPASLFRDLREDGTLAKILRIAFNYKREMNWSEIDFKNPDMNEGIQGLFLTIEHELTQMNLLRRPRVHFHSNVPPELVSTLSRILTNYAGEVVSDPDDATHLVQFDPEVDATSQQIEADYLRTLKMQPEDGIAFVHWWYYPDSYDEWIPLQDVEGQPPDEAELNRKPKQWRVSCRFIRDVEVFNEWGNELDYEVEDDSAEDLSGDKKKKSDKNKNKAKKQEELAKKRKEGILPEFIEATSVIMADEPRPSENPAFKRLRVAEMHNGNQVVENAPDDNGTNGSAAESETSAPNGPVAMRVAESKDAADGSVHNGAQQQPPPPSKPVIEVASSGRKRYRPKATHADALPEWFDDQHASAVERRYLPEFFHGRSKNKTPERYIEARNMIINLYKQNPEQYLFATTVRKQLPIDASTVLRIHELLDAFGIINNKPKAEQERPQDMFPTILNDAESQDLINRYASRPQSWKVEWSKATDEALREAVLKHEDNWEQVAADIGGDVTPEDCMLRFCQMPIFQCDATDKQQHLSWQADVAAAPDAVEAACSAAWNVLRGELQTPDDDNKSVMVQQAASSAAAGLAVATARLDAQQARQTLNHMVDDYVTSRLQSLEEKAKALEEMEKWVSLESERLELERRDLHIQRAKHALNIQPSTSTLR